MPTVIRWPGVIKPGTVINDFGAHEDMLPTLVAAAGDTDGVGACMKGRQIVDVSYKLHLDGYDLGPSLRGRSAVTCQEFIYWSDDGSVDAFASRRLRF